MFTVPGATQLLPLGVVKSLLQYAATCAEPDRSHIYGGVVQLHTKVEGIENETTSGLEAAGASEQRVAVAIDPTKVSRFFSTLIPLSAVPVLLALDGDDLNFSETDKQLYFSANGVEIYVAKLAKKYPNCSAVIPKEFAYVYEVSAEEFKSALRTVEPIIDPRDNKGCGVKVHFLDNAVTVKSLGTGDSAEDSVPCSQTLPDPIFESADFSISLNHRFLSDFFGAVSGTVTFSANGSEKPVLLEAGNKKTLIAAMKEKK